MNLNETPDFVTRSIAHYVFVEKIGPIQANAQKAWEEMIKALPKVVETNKISGRIGLYSLEPKMLYRAGVIVDSKPASVPEGLRYELVEGGKYARYILTGPYQDLPEACSKVFKLFGQSKLSVRKDAYYIENYVNDPRDTPGDKLITEILIPVN